MTFIQSAILPFCLNLKMGPSRKKGIAQTRFARMAPIVSLASHMSQPFLICRPLQTAASIPVKLQ